MQKFNYTIKSYKGLHGAAYQHDAHEEHTFQ